MFSWPSNGVPATKTPGVGTRIVGFTGKEESSSKRLINPSK